MPKLFDSKDLIIRHSIILLLSFFFGLSIIADKPDLQNIDGVLRAWLWNFLFIATIWNGNKALYELGPFYKLDWETQTKQKIIAALVVALFWPVLIHYFLNLFLFEPILGVPCDLKAKENIIFLMITVTITLLINAIMVAIEFFNYWKKTNLEKEALKRTTISAEFESLKNQIDPHFLFNSLNVLSSLIEENPENAQQFTTSLSKIYRYVLEQKDKQLVTVSEELAFAKTYMKLLKMRFENSITFELSDDFENPDARVVPLSLQLLLENTIKHNVVSENKPLHIKIYIKDNFLVVENNLQKKEVLQDRKGVGLQNIVSRYAILSERKVLIDETKETFAVYLPILTKQISIMETTNTFNENTSYLRAKERVEKLKGFYGNFASYCVVIPVLIIINLNSSHNFQWFWFPMLGWGLGVLFHAFETFGYGKSWEEKKIQEILNKQNNTNNKWK